MGWANRTRRKVLHDYGPVGFEPCSREWPHDGPCAHELKPEAIIEQEAIIDAAARARLQYAARSFAEVADTLWRYDQAIEAVLLATGTVQGASGELLALDVLRGRTWASESAASRYLKARERGLDDPRQLDKAELPSGDSAAES